MKIFQNERIFTVMVVIVCVLMSAFMSDSGCIAMWMPIIAAVAAGSKGKIRSKMVIMPAGIACIVGGATTLVDPHPKIRLTVSLCRFPVLKQAWVYLR